MSTEASVYPPSTMPESSVGQSLREAREKRGMSLEEVSSATKIRMSYLRALESDSYEELPSLVFARGFIRSYGDFLGLDGDATAEALTSPTVTPELTVTGLRRRRGWRPWVLAVALLVACAVAFVVVQYSRAVEQPAVAQPHGMTLGGGS